MKLDPSRLQRAVRYAVYFAAAALVWFFLDRFSMVRLAAEPVALFDFAGGQRVVVEIYGAHRAPEPGDAVLVARTPGERLALRLVALPGDALEIDAALGRVRRADAQVWYPAPPRALERLPLRPGEVLLLSEEPAARELGAVLALDQLRQRVVGALPF